MSNTWLNIRFGVRHLQVVLLSEWIHLIRQGRSPFTFEKNPYQEGLRANEPDTWRWFQFYELRWPW